MSSQVQDYVTFAIVGFVFWRAAARPVFQRAADPFSKLLLRKGRVKWAMKVRAFALSGAKRVAS
jgi:hypothetical protein